MSHHHPELQEIIAEALEDIKSSAQELVHEGVSVTFELATEDNGEGILYPYVKVLFGPEPAEEPEAPPIPRG